MTLVIFDDNTKTYSVMNKNNKKIKLIKIRNNDSDKKIRKTNSLNNLDQKPEFICYFKIKHLCWFYSKVITIIIKFKSIK